MKKKFKELGHFWATLGYNSLSAYMDCYFIPKTKARYDVLRNLSCAEFMVFHAENKDWFNLYHKAGEPLDLEDDLQEAV